MTEPRETVTKLHQLLDADPIDSDLNLNETNDAQRISDEELDAALSHVGLQHLSPAAQEMILGLTQSSTSLEPDVRTKLMNAAKRALRTRRDEASPLPRLLFLTRCASNEDISEVATAVGVSSDKLTDVERGQVKIDELGAQTVASWIRHFSISTRQAEVALRKSLASPMLQDVAAAAPAAATTDTDQFIADVLAMLNS